MTALKADFVEGYEKAHGGQDGVHKAWGDIEPKMLVVAKAEVEKAVAAEGEKAQAAARAALRRSQMTTKEKIAYVGEHGADSYKGLAY